MSSLRRLGYLAITAALMGCPQIASADQIETFQLAEKLGALLAAEKPCGFTFDQGAVSAWVDANVHADDMDFTEALNMIVSNRDGKVDEMSPAQRVVFCRQTERVARALHFIK